MPINLTKTLRKALVELQAEQKRISEQIATIEQVLAAGGSRRRPAARSQAASRGKQPRKSMSAAARKAVSRRMKAYWAKRKAETSRAKAKAAT